MRCLWVSCQQLTAHISGDADARVVGRFIAGIGVGMFSMVVPMYIAEVAPPEIRGSLLVLEEFSIVFGIMYAYLSLPLNN